MKCKWGIPLPPLVPLHVGKHLKNTFWVSSFFSVSMIERDFKPLCTPPIVLFSSFQLLVLHLFLQPNHTGACQHYFPATLLGPTSRGVCVSAGAAPCPIRSRWIKALNDDNEQEPVRQHVDLSTMSRTQRLCAFKCKEKERFSLNPLTPTLCCSPLSRTQILSAYACLQKRFLCPRSQGDGELASQPCTHADSLVFCPFTIERGT